MRPGHHNSQDSAWSRVQGHVPQKYESKRNIFFNRSCYSLTRCTLRGLRDSALLCVKWRCQHQPLRACTHSRSPRVKFILLRDDNNPDLLHSMMATLSCDSRVCLYGPIYLHTTFFSSSSQAKPHVPLSHKATGYFLGGSEELGSPVEGFWQL